MLRKIDQRVVRVGHVKLVDFQNEMATARIVDEFKDFQIQVGDYLIMDYKSKKRMSVKEYIHAYAKNKPDSSE